MQKIILVIVGLLIIGYFTWQGIQTKPADTIPQAIVTDVAGTTESGMLPDPSLRDIENTKVYIEFKGFGPGKEHTGSFSGITSNLTRGDAGILQGIITVDMNSLSTDTEAVTKHLKTKDFFDTTKYPTASIKMKSMTQTAVTATFTIHGITKDVTFPYVQSDTGYTADFTLNMKEFGIDQKFANETVQIIVTVPFK